MSIVFKEEDMYPPIKKFFSELGYDVKAEVKDCDIAMTKNDELVIIELKKSFNMTLLYQAIARQKLTSQVYVAVPRPKKAKGQEYTSMLHIAKKLEIGLMTVAMDSSSRSVQILNFPPTTEVKITPRNGKKRKGILEEMEGRSVDLNMGGSTGRKLVTAYRERAIRLACALEKTGATTTPTLVKKMGCDGKTYSTLRGNHYGWFLRLENARFDLSDEGRKMLDSGEFRELVAWYRKEMKDCEI